MAKPLSNDEQNNKTETTPSTKADAPKASRCPLVDNPLAECYCVVLTSLKIPNIIAYCQGNYENCETYQQWQRTGEPPQAPVETPLTAKQEQHPPQSEAKATGRVKGQSRRKR